MNASNNTSQTRNDLRNKICYNTLDYKTWSRTRALFELNLSHLLNPSSGINKPIQQALETMEKEEANG